MDGADTTPMASGAAVPVAIYTRVSTDNQVGGRFDSCESQLAICRDFVEEMGGTISAGRADSGGAVFTVRIPLASFASGAHSHRKQEDGT